MPHPHLVTEILIFPLHVSAHRNPFVHGRIIAMCDPYLDPNRSSWDTECRLQTNGRYSMLCEPFSLQGHFTIFCCGHLEGWQGGLARSTGYV